MIALESFRNQLCNLFEEQFTDAEFIIDERRSTILEIRIFLAPEIFMEVYVNGMTGKKALQWLRMKSIFGAMTNIGIGITIRLKILILIYNAASRLSKKL